MSFLSLSFPLHSAFLVLEELVAIVVLLENSLIRSCRCQKNMGMLSLVSYRNATSFCRCQHQVDGIVSLGYVRTSPISIFILFLNRYFQVCVVCIAVI